MTMKPLLSSKHCPGMPVSLWVLRPRASAPDSSSGPTITGSSKIVVLPPQGSASVLTARQKLQLLGQPFDLIEVPPDLEETALSKLAGNCQDVQAVAVMLLLCLGIVHWDAASKGPPSRSPAKTWCAPPRLYFWRKGTLVDQASSKTRKNVKKKGLKIKKPQRKRESAASASGRSKAASSGTRSQTTVGRSQRSPSKAGSRFKDIC